MCDLFILHFIISITQPSFDRCLKYSLLYYPFSDWHLCSSSVHVLVLVHVLAHMYACSLQRTFDMFLPIAPDEKFNALFSLYPLTMKVTLFPPK